MDIIAIVSSPWFIPVILFVFVFLIVNTVIKALVPAKHEGKLLLAIVLILLVAAGYFYTSYNDYSSPLFSEGVRVGQLAGVDKSVGWCIEYSNEQFLDYPENEALVMLQGYAYGCIGASNDLAKVCRNVSHQLPAPSNNRLLGKYCGSALICYQLYSAINEYCLK